VLPGIACGSGLSEESFFLRCPVFLPSYEQRCATTSFFHFIFQADSLSGFHTNTHIPIVVGGQMRYEVTGDPLYKVKV
jgi:hypothetical protein